MAIQKSDLLYYLHPKVGGYEPMVGGGQVTASRDGQNRYLRRQRRFAKVGAGKQPTAWTAVSDPLRRTQVLDLEKGQTPANDDSVLFTSGSAWSRSNVQSEASVPSIFDDLPSGGEARRFARTTSNVAIRQEPGTFSGNIETWRVIVENISMNTVTLFLTDVTDSQIIGDVEGDFSTESVSEPGAAVEGSAARKITDRGPNGGKVMEFVLMDSGTAGNTRRLELFLEGDASGQKAVVHYLDHIEDAYIGSPIPYTGAPASRTGAQYSVEPGFYDSDFRQVWYFALAPRTLIGNTGTFYVVATHGDGGDPRGRVIEEGGDPGGYKMQWRDANGNDAFAGANVGGPDPWQFVEGYYTLDPADGGRRLVVRDHLGNVGDSGWQTPSSWTTPGSLGANERITYNEGGNLVGSNRGAQRIVRHYGVPNSAPDTDPFGDGAEAVLDELAAYHLDPAA